MAIQKTDCIVISLANPYAEKIEMANKIIALFALVLRIE
jgi:hypothetical protein